MEMAVTELKKNKALLCLECGKCTAVCPISAYDREFSPRRMLAEGIFYGGGDLISDKRLWSCLTCLLCSERCPVDVRYSEYMKGVREIAQKQGNWGEPSHGSALLHIMEMMTAPKLNQNRTGWINGNIKTAEKSDVLFFTGCLPYYEDFFAKDFDFHPISIAVDTVRILNHLKIKPAVLPNERCCGHDLYWLGKIDEFNKLRELNLKEFERSEAKTIVTACAECAYTLKELYVKKLGLNSIEVKHISELVAENIDRFKFKEQNLKITYQDPCRLGRHLNIYDSPRDAMKAVPGMDLNEMPHNKRGSICCGTTNWMNCGASSSRIQKARLTEAKNTGADTLVTACPKCQIHFRCSQCGKGKDKEKTDIKLKDFTNIIASAIDG